MAMKDYTVIGTTLSKYKGFASVVKVPNHIKDHEVDTIGGFLFKDHTEIVEVLIPKGVVKISGLAFQGCSNLKKITISDSVKEIDGYVFDNCSSLEEVVLPNGLIQIASGMFNGCKSLKKVIIPESVTKIEEFSFSNCTSLQEIYIPTSVTEIDFFAFNGCDDLKIIRGTDPALQAQNAPTPEQTEQAQPTGSNTFSFTEDRFISINGNKFLALPNGFSSSGDIPGYLFVAWLPTPNAPDDWRNAPCRLYVQNDMIKQIPNDMTLQEFEDVYHNMENAMPPDKGQVMGVFRGGNPETVWFLAKLGWQYYWDMVVAQTMSVTVKLEFGDPALESAFTSDLVREWLKHSGAVENIPKGAAEAAPNDAEKLGDMFGEYLQSLSKRTELQSSGKNFLSFTSGKRVRGLDFSIGVPDGFAAQENVDDRDFVIWLPNKNNPQDPNSAPCAMFATKEHLTADGDVPLEQWVDIGKQRAEMAAQMGFSHDAFTHTAKYVTYTAQAMGSDCWMIMHTVTPRHNYELRISFCDEQMFADFTPEVMDSWMNTILPDGCAEEETPAPAPTAPAQKPRKAASKHTPKPKKEAKSYHFTFKDDIVLRIGGNRFFTIPDSFKLSPSVPDCSFMAWLPNQDDPENWRTASCRIFMKNDLAERVREGQEKIEDFEKLFRKEAKECASQGGQVIGIFRGGQPTTVWFVSETGMRYYLEIAASKNTISTINIEFDSKEVEAAFTPDLLQEWVNLCGATEVIPTEEEERRRQREIEDEYQRKELERHEQLKAQIEENERKDKERQAQRKKLVEEKATWNAKLASVDDKALRDAQAELERLNSELKSCGFLQFGRKKELNVQIEKQKTVVAEAQQRYDDAANSIRGHIADLEKQIAAI